MNTQLSQYTEAIKADYSKWSDQANINPVMKREFEQSVGLDFGRKYVKIMVKGTVHSFVVLENTKKFAKGDILKAATFSSPSTNFARGNVFTLDESKVQWTGA